MSATLNADQACAISRRRSAPALLEQRGREANSAVVPEIVNLRSHIFAFANVSRHADGGGILVVAWWRTKMRYSIPVIVLILVQQPAPQTPGSQGPGPNWTAADDHRNMLEQLGIKT